MPGDSVLIGHSEDGVTTVMLYYNYVHRKVMVMLFHVDPVSAAWVEDAAHYFESDSRAKAEVQAQALCREFSIPFLDEYTVTASDMPIDREEFEAWALPAPPHLN